MLSRFFEDSKNLLTGKGGLGASGCSLWVLLSSEFWSVGVAKKNWLGEAEGCEEWQSREPDMKNLG